MDKQFVISKSDEYVVHVVFNAVYNDPGEAFYGPFKSRKTAEEFELDFCDSNMEVESTVVLVLNRVSEGV